MNRPTRLLLALGLTQALLVPAPTLAASAAEAGLQAIGALAQLNGQALACQDQPAARRAKGLMLAHAPKTARYGDAFDSGTQRAYLAQTRSEAPCPDGATLATRLDAVAQQLQASLPADPAAGAGPR